ncbi:hypothetical protein Tco_0434887 [Tanacetum coccineum]
MQSYSEVKVISLSGVINMKTDFRTVESRKLCSCIPILALPDTNAVDYYRLLRCFKEGFGRCVNANEKSPNALGERRGLVVVSDNDGEIVLSRERT